MPETKKEQTYQTMTFDAIKIGLASPEKILEWSRGCLLYTSKHILHFILLETMHRDLFQKDLEKEFKVRRSTATGILQLLEKKGYLYREPVKEDARLKRIVPTEKAAKLRGDLLKNIRRSEARLRRGISEEDMDVFIEVLKQISSNLSCGEKQKEISMERKGESDE